MIVCSAAGPLKQLESFWLHKQAVISLHAVRSQLSSSLEHRCSSFGDCCIDVETCAAGVVQLKSGQQPPAIVLCCSDSRAPPEMIMDQGLGDVFVVRYV